MKGNLMKGKMKGHFRKGKKGTVHELEFILRFLDVCHLHHHHLFPKNDILRRDLCCPGELSASLPAPCSPINPIFKIYFLGHHHHWSCCNIDDIHLSQERMTNLDKSLLI